MITFHEDIFELHTDHTSYLFKDLPTGQLEHLYYGPRITLTSKEALTEKRAFGVGNGNIYSDDDGSLCLENLCQEISSRGKGDLGDTFVDIEYTDGSRTSDFVYKSARITKGTHALKGLPSAYASLEEDGVETMEVLLEEREKQVKLYLYYTVFPGCDVITRSARVENLGADPIKLRRLMSLQLDLDEAGLKMTTFGGAWAREMEKAEHVVESGCYVNGSVCGMSSNRASNFVMVSDADTTELYGRALGTYLVYSGNHYEALSVGAYEKSRLLCGIHPEGFSFTLSEGESLESPECVMGLSMEGYRGLSLSLHHFVREHIVRGEWKKKERPVLVNSWEATYFGFKEHSLIKLAKAAREVGAELFVLDDGWFGKRNDDKTSLGDWYANTKKLPGGLEGISRKINELGLSFGIWVEPEMVSEDSDLYREHPDWAVQIPGRGQSLGRNQYLLDLTRDDVRTYLKEAMERVFATPGLTYVKWDMNRVFSDAYSQALAPEKQGEFYHRYILGLYDLLEHLTGKFPHILFESCASGGNRADLGMLCYMPQLWASDNTDAMARCDIQEGYSYGYPLSVLGCHVSGCPNHQTLRNTPLETRYAVAFPGLLGYELNLCELSGDEKKEIKGQIALYKIWRSLIMKGDFYRLSNRKAYHWTLSSTEEGRSIHVMVNKDCRANTYYDKALVPGLCEDKKYHFYNLPGRVDIMQFGSLINMVSPIHVRQDGMMHKLLAGIVKMNRETEDYILTGRELEYSGVKLSPRYGGTGFDDKTRVFGDYASRLYFIEEEK